MESRINGILKNAHHQISNKISKNYTNVILPKLDTKRLVQGSSNKKLNRALYRSKILGFYNTLMSDRNGMFYGSEEGVHEKYSSKLCSYCKHIATKRDSKEIKICKKCSKKIDRDINGSRNIYYMNKYLVK